MNRREFLVSSAAAAAAVAWAGGRVIGAQKVPPVFTTALIGTGWWGTNIVREAIASGRCKVVAICDIDPNQREKAAQEIEKLSGEKPKHYSDFRELLDKEKPQIAIVATPDHWHPLITIAAVKAGANVYVEKPVSHTIKEGRAMVKAARETGKMVQVGTHRRVSPHNISGREFVRSGQAGKIGMVRCFVLYGGNGPEEPTANTEPPKGMDWDMWCGPGPLRPFNRRIHPKGFRSFLDYANGQIGDWGIHWLDQTRWILDLESPHTVFSTGGRTIKGPPINGPQGQTTDAPDHEVVAYAFDNDLTVTWEHRYFGANNNEKTDPRQAVGCYFYGTKGVFHQGWLDGWTFYPVDPKQPPIHQDAHLNEPDQQNIKELFADFLEAIDNNRLPLCDIEVGHRSTTLALLGMLSLKHGKSIAWDGAKEEIIDDPEASKLLSRVYRGPWEYPTG